MPTSHRRRPAARHHGGITWPYLMGRTTFGSVSLTADGSVLGFAGGTNGPHGPEDAWVLPTNSPPGPLTSRARKVLHVRTGVFRVVLSNTGSQAYVETLSAPHGGAVVLGRYSTTTGKRIRLLGRLSPGARPWPSCPSAWTRPTGTCWCTATTTSIGWL